MGSRVVGNLTIALATEPPGFLIMSLRDFKGGVAKRFCKLGLVQRDGVLLVNLDSVRLVIRDEKSELVVNSDGPGTPQILLLL